MLTISVYFAACSTVSVFSYNELQCGNNVGIFFRVLEGPVVKVRRTRGRTSQLMT